MIYVYPLGNGSKWNNNEIRLSIKSINKYCDVDRVVILGNQVPNDLSKAHDIITVRDQSNRKQNNVIFKLMQLREHIKEPFTLMNDDFFALNKIEDIPNYYCGTLEEKLKAFKTYNAWATSMANVIKHFYGKGVEPLNYSIHVPYVVEDLDLFFSMCKSIYSGNQIVSLRSLYLNTVNSNTKEIVRDPKFDVPFTLNSQFNSAIQHCDWFSIGDRFLNDWGKNKLIELYKTE